MAALVALVIVPGSDELTGSYSGPEVGIEEAAMDLPEARFWPTKDVGCSVAISAFELSR